MVDVEELEEKEEGKKVTNELETPQMQGRQEELDLEWKQTEERVRLLLSLINQVWTCFEFFLSKWKSFLTFLVVESKCLFPPLRLTRN